MSTVGKWKTSAPMTAIQKPVFDLALAIKNSRLGIGNIVGYSSPLLVFLYLKTMGASFLFSGCIGSALLGFIYLPIVGSLINLGSLGGLLSFVWVALAASMYLSHQPDGQGVQMAGAEAETVWLHSQALVEFVMRVGFKPLEK